MNEFNLKNGFENYTDAKIFYAPSNDIKVCKNTHTHTHTHTHNSICYINSFDTLFLN